MSSPKGAVTFLGSEDRREAEKVDPYDNMIEALATNRADVAFHVGILPGAPRRCDHFFHPHGSGEGGELCAIDRVTIAQQISWHFTNGEEEEVHLTKLMPFLVEDELLQFGAVFEKAANFSRLSVADWLQKHGAVSEEDFSREPHRNRFTVLLGRTALTLLSQLGGEPASRS